MKLKEYLQLISDEDARIELELDDGSEHYKYVYLCISDYREGLHKAYNNWTVVSTSFKHHLFYANISIQIKQEK